MDFFPIILSFKLCSSRILKDFGAFSFSIISDLFLLFSTEFFNSFIRILFRFFILSISSVSDKSSTSCSKIFQGSFLSFIESIYGWKEISLKIFFVSLLFIFFLIGSLFPIVIDYIVGQFTICSKSGV